MFPKLEKLHQIRSSKAASVWVNLLSSAYQSNALNADSWKWAKRHVISGQSIRSVGGQRRTHQCRRLASFVCQSILHDFGYQLVAICKSCPPVVWWLEARKEAPLSYSHPDSGFRNAAKSPAHCPVSTQTGTGHSPSLRKFGTFEATSWNNFYRF